MVKARIRLRSEEDSERGEQSPSALAEGAEHAHMEGVLPGPQQEGEEAGEADENQPQRKE